MITMNSATCYLKRRGTIFWKFNGQCLRRSEFGFDGDSQDGPKKFTDDQGKKPPSLCEKLRYSSTRGYDGTAGIDILSIEYQAGDAVMKVIQGTGQHHRSGMSRIDVLVGLLVFVIVLSVLAPAVNSPSRRSPRKLQCLNNMRNVGLALQAFSTSTGGQLPSLTVEMPVKNSSEKEGTMNVGWPVAILPALDATAVLRNIKQNAIVTSRADGKMTLSIADTEKIWIPAFTCPDDKDSDRKPGGLSYVVNAGFMSRSLFHGDPDGLHRLGLLSWNGNDIPGEADDIQIEAATGVFWRPNEAFRSSLDYLSTGDGQSSTIMITENLQAGLWHDTDTAKIGFGLPVAATKNQVPSGMGAEFEAVDRPLNANFSGGTLTTAKPQDWRINSDLEAAVGTRPRPSSQHVGGVNVIMCDGRGIFLNKFMDPQVYVKLLTPNGLKYGEDAMPQGAY